jgi:hypothetical protein
MSSGQASPNNNSSSKRRKTTHTTRHSSTTARIPVATPPEELAEPTLANPTCTVAPLDAAIAKIESFVRTLRYAQQRAVFRDNATRYITAFATFYRENKSLSKMKDDPTYCPASCRINIPLQPTPRVKESAAFKALADESAGVAKEISLQMGKMILKCKLLNNADKKRETIEIYAKALSNMAEILLAEIDANTSDKHALVADLLTQHQNDVINHLSIPLPDFVNIYKSTNNITTLPSSLANSPHPQTTPDKPPPTTNTTTPTPQNQPHTSPNQNQPSRTPTVHPPHTHNQQNLPTAPTAPLRTLAGDFVTAGALLQPSPPPYHHAPPVETHLPPLPPRENPQQRPTSPPHTPAHANTPTANTTADNTFDYSDAFTDAFNVETMAYNETTAPTETQTHLSPIRTILNPYTKKQNQFSFSRDFTSQELTELDTITRAEITQHENQRLTLLNSLREKAYTPHSPSPTTTNPQTPTTNNPTNVLQSVTYHTTRNDDAISTLTAMDDSTPSSRPSVTFHPSITTNPYTIALHKLHTAVLKCFVEAQTEYIDVQNSILVEAHLTRIAARQRTEQTAESTAIILHSEPTTPARTIGIAIDDRIHKNRKELEQRLKAVEQQLEQAKNRNAAIARRLNATPQQSQQLVKDTGAPTAGAATKKSALPKPHPLHQQHRWVPPSKTQPVNASPAADERATQQNRTAPGNAPSNNRHRRNTNIWPTRQRK